MKIQYYLLIGICAISISCDEKLDRVPLDEANVICGNPDMDLIYDVESNTCDCPDTLYSIGLDRREDLDLWYPEGICKRKSGFSYLLLSECNCTDATYDRDSIVITFDDRIGRLLTDTANTHFQLMAGRTGLAQPYYRPLDNEGDEWGSPEIMPDYYRDSTDVSPGIFDSSWPSGFVHFCSMGDNYVRGEVHGKFDDKDSISVAWVRWYDFQGQIIDSCKWTLMK
ncbi:MAG TPA: hypothetical protein VJ917_04350 [Saprospiraceae bacterium]|nr:hypothetical protein [Saprospiraceae bacterium]